MRHRAEVKGGTARRSEHVPVPGANRLRGRSTELLSEKIWVPTGR